jgi:hypothetical protein
MAMMAGVFVCALAQTKTPIASPAHAAVVHHHARKKAAPATIEVINGTSVHTQTFSEGGGKVVGNEASIRVLNGTTWSTATFEPQRTRKSVQARGVTQVNVLNGTEARTQVFKGGVPPVRKGAAQKGHQPVVIGMESVDGKKAIAGSDASLSSRKVVVGVESSDSVKAVQAPAPKGRPRRPPYHPAQPKSKTN